MNLTPRREGGQGGLAGSLCQCWWVAGPTGGFLRGHWGPASPSLALRCLDPEYCWGAASGLLCNCPAGQAPPGSHMGPRLGPGGAWTGKGMGMWEGTMSGWRWPCTVPLSPTAAASSSQGPGVPVPGGAF